MKEVEEERGRELLDVCPLLLGCGCCSFYLGHEKHRASINQTNLSNTPKKNKGSCKPPRALITLTCILSPFRCHVLVAPATI